ncbi:hypothetical protein [Paraconexibacter sp.]|uniref:hypothetical protein n=1 Tax=Paraconexibacter sp. TaxID=2949640 RepID=UPI00356AC57B
MVVIDDIQQASAAVGSDRPAPAERAELGLGHPADESAARRTLRAQVRELERQLADTLIAAFPRTGVDVAVPSTGRGPRVLDLAELEVLRDELAEKLRRARQTVHEAGEQEARNRDLLERMLRDPKRYRFARLPNRDLGESGCGVWQVRPRLGLIGMLAGWWHVKLSSGCPLVAAVRAPRQTALSPRSMRTDGQT